MNAVAYCNTQNIVGMNQDADFLIRQFCACRDAKRVLQKIAAQIFVQVGDFPHNRISFTDEGQDLEIQIPKKMMKTKEALLSLIWEIFNAKIVPEFQSLRDEAKKGHLGMNEYAKLFETIEFKSKQGGDSLVKTCQPVYKIKPEPGTPDLDVTLWNHEIVCHTDKIRERWINEFQDIYCDHHPEDFESCQIKKEDLCDYYSLQQASPVIQKRIYKKRTCDALSLAPSKVKEYYESEFGNLNDLCAPSDSQPKDEL